jgi:predicted small lipoprotein YifL
METPMKHLIAAALLALALSGCGPSGPKGTPSPPGAKVFFIEPKDGATVTSPVTVKFGIEGMEVVPAGTEKANSGHHHVLIDTKLDDYASTIPVDANHVLFGKGQTEAPLDLKPGKHTLQLILGDQNHIPHDPPVQSEVITITVE